MNFSNIAKKIFYLFVFLLPVFFIPNSIISPVMNQKAFLLVGTLIPLSIFLIEVFKNKKEVVKGSLPIKLIFGFISAALISFFLSGYLFQSYWGYPIQSDSLFSFTLFFSLLFLSINIFDKPEERINSYKYFSLGALFLALIYLFQITVGPSLGTEAILPSSEESAIIFSLALVYSLYYIFHNFNYKEGKGALTKIISQIVFAIVFIVMIFLMGIKLAWLLSAFGLFFVFWKFMQKRKFDINSPEPFIALILMIFFVINFLLPLNTLPILKPVFSAEPTPSISQSLNIIEKSLSKDFKTLLIGTGPASFPYNFSQHKDNSFTDKEIVFTHPSSTFFLILNDFGLLGALTFLALLFYFAWFTLKLILKQRKEERDSDEILLISPLFMLFYSLFFYRFSFLIVTIFFLFLGLWISSREYSKKDFLNNIFSKILFSFIFIGLLTNTYFFFFQYSAEKDYQEAAILSEKKEPLDKIISLVEKADNGFSSADYAVVLSNLYLTKGANAYDEYFNNIDKADQSTSKKDEAITLVSKAEETAIKATKLDSRDFRTWYNLGSIYKNVENVLGDKKGSAINNYKKAEELAPLNYEIYLDHGQKLEEDGDLKGAFDLLKKASEIIPENEQLKSVLVEMEAGLNSK